jgi:hypothetical protein
MSKARRIASVSATRQNGRSKVPYQRRSIRDIPRKEYPIYPTGPDPLYLFDAVIRRADNGEAVRQIRKQCQIFHQFEVRRFAQRQVLTWIIVRLHMGDGVRKLWRHEFTLLCELKGRCQRKRA